jgi:hypothetical protein
MMKMALRRHFFGGVLLLSLNLLPALSFGAEDPWKYLDDFTPLPSTLTRIADRYVAMIFIKREEDLSAAVIFSARCDLTSCQLLHRAGYAVVNGAGSKTRLYVDPEERELIELMGAIIARYSADF